MELAMPDDYLVHAARSDDVHEGRIWIKNDGLRSEIEGKRPILRIEAKGRSVYCEALCADSLYLDAFNDHLRGRGMKTIDFGRHPRLIFLSAWFRNELGLPADVVGREYPFDINVARGPLVGLWRYPRNHPQAVVRGSAMLGIIGAGLGVIGIGLGIGGFGQGLVNAQADLSAFFVALGAGLTVLGLWGMTR